MDFEEGLKLLKAKFETGEISYRDFIQQLIDLNQHIVGNTRAICALQREVIKSQKKEIDDRRELLNQKQKAA